MEVFQAAMPCLTLNDLPAPPAGKSGWPWTEGPEPPHALTFGEKCWPRISVITPSFNQGEFLEQTIRSVLLQGYPNLEYIVIDGGSTDASVGILKKYEKFLAAWVSEPDRGQSHAINKGFERATGQIMCWLNSDDFYLPGTLQTIAEELRDGNDTFAVVGHCVQVFTDGRPPYKGIGKFESPERLLQFWKGYQMHQPSIFWRREVFEKVGYLDESQYYLMDFDYWVRIAKHYTFKNIDQYLSASTYHSAAKTGDGFVKYFQDLRAQSPRYWPSPFTLSYWRLKISMLAHIYFLPGIRRVRNSIKFRFHQAKPLLTTRKTN